jgi:DUF1365 family protein
MSLPSAIYEGEVVHRRFQPKEHRLSYRVFSLLLDLDELHELDRSLKLFGHNKRALFSFHDKDHGALDGQTSLKDWVHGHLQKAGLPGGDIHVKVLCYPRILGYVFNPLTVYFCYTREGTLAAILYEVCNTFHERHTYVVPCVNTGETVRHSCEKALYVSPFMPMDCSYHFTTDPPAETVAVRIMETSRGGKMLYAAFEGNALPLTDGNLIKIFLKYPLMTLRVTVAIHTQALRLLVKGLRFFRHVSRTERVTSSVEPEAKPGD